jgi:hypothetical protein
MQSFLGVGAQHQNAKAERAIQTVMYMARTFMVHASLHWTEHGVDDISLWPFAVKHAVWLYNRVPNRESGLTLMEFITKQKADHSDLLHSHVWGCPAYVEAVSSNFEFCANDGSDGAMAIAMAVAVAMPVRGSLYLNDDDMNFALISPVGSVDGELDDENTTTLLGRVELKKKKIEMLPDTLMPVLSEQS